MDRRGAVRRLLAIVAVTGIVLTWGARARAESAYPTEVMTALGLPPQSNDITCATCHLSSIGGFSLSDPNLAVFGALLEQDGIAPNSAEAQFVSVLAEIKVDQQKAYADLLAGRNPNPDVTDAADVHTPEYGCDVGRGASGRGLWIPLVLGLASISVWRRRARGARR